MAKNNAACRLEVKPPTFVDPFHPRVTFAVKRSNNDGGIETQSDRSGCEDREVVAIASPTTKRFRWRAPTVAIHRVRNVDQALLSHYAGDDMRRALVAKRIHRSDPEEMRDLLGSNQLFDRPLSIFRRRRNTEADAR